MMENLIVSWETHRNFIQEEKTMWAIWKWRVRTDFGKQLERFELFFQVLRLLNIRVVRDRPRSTMTKLTDLLITDV